jgi:hypothetical protein
MQSANYRFNRSKDISGFLSKNRASTDAINALEQWCVARNERRYEVTCDEDDYLEARLSWEDNDNEAGADLNGRCTRVGVERNFKEH